MKFTLRQWLWFCAAFGSALAILQRPLRAFALDEFLNGIGWACYWMLWLCYREQWFSRLVHSTSEFIGILTGVAIQVLFVVVIIGRLDRPRVKVPQ